LHRQPRSLAASKIRFGPIQSQIQQLIQSISGIFPEMVMGCAACRPYPLYVHYLRETRGKLSEPSMSEQTALHKRLRLMSW
jgi:hypothetical protein